MSGGRRQRFGKASLKRVPEPDVIRVPLLAIVPVSAAVYSAAYTYARPMQQSEASSRGWAYSGRECGARCGKLDDGRRNSEEWRGWNESRDFGWKAHLSSGQTGMSARPLDLRRASGLRQSAVDSPCRVLSHREMQ